jgi:hypothetical protein
MKSATGDSKFELTLRDIIIAPGRALRIGHLKILAYSLMMMSLCWATATSLYEYLAIFTLSFGIENYTILGLVLKGAFGLSVLFASPFILAGIAVPVRTLWSTGRMDLKPLILLTPKTLLHGFSSLLRGLPKVVYSVLPILGCFVTLQALVEHKASPWAEILYFWVMVILSMLFLRQVVILALGLALAAAFQIDIRLAQRAIATARRIRWIQLLVLVAVWGSVLFGLVMFDGYYHGNVWLIAAGIVSCLWAFLISFSLLALQIGYESGM